MKPTSESEVVSAVSPETNRRQAGDVSLYLRAYKGGDRDNRRAGESKAKSCREILADEGIPGTCGYSSCTAMRETEANETAQLFKESKR